MTRSQNRHPSSAAANSQPNWCHFFESPTWQRRSRVTVGVIDPYWDSPQRPACSDWRSIASATGLIHFLMRAAETRNPYFESERLWVKAVVSRGPASLTVTIAIIFWLRLPEVQLAVALSLSFVLLWSEVTLNRTEREREKLERIKSKFGKNACRASARSSPSYISPLTAVTHVAVHKKQKRKK